MPDNKICSAGMDGKICVWKSKGVSCDTLTGHESSISQIKTDNKDTMISASYDCTLRIWPLKFSKFKHKNCGDILVGIHKKPVTVFDWHNSLVVSGDKNGVLVFWDINKGEPFHKVSGHKGAVNCIKFSDPDRDALVATAGIKDGIVNLFDLRTLKPVMSQKAHSSCVTSLQFTGNGDLVSTGTDNLISVFPR